MKKAMTIPQSSEIMPTVPNDIVVETMKNADILVHVEPLDEKDRLFYRLSFSTKLVDYFYAGKCILGIGGNTASLRYLADNDCGVVVNDMSTLEKRLSELLEDTTTIQEYGKKAWRCGVDNHQISKIQDKMLAEFLKITADE